MSKIPNISQTIKRVVFHKREPKRLPVKIIFDTTFTTDLDDNLWLIHHQNIPKNNYLFQALVDIKHSIALDMIEYDTGIW